MLVNFILRVRIESLDLDNGFHHIRSNTVNASANASNSIKYQYLFPVMPFGLKSTPRYLLCRRADQTVIHEVKTYSDLSRWHYCTKFIQLLSFMQMVKCTLKHYVRGNILLICWIRWLTIHKDNLKDCSSESCQVKVVLCRPHCLNAAELLG